MYIYNFFFPFCLPSNLSLMVCLATGLIYCKACLGFFQKIKRQGNHPTPHDLAADCTGMPPLLERTLKGLNWHEAGSPWVPITCASLPKWDLYLSTRLLTFSFIKRFQEGNVTQRLLLQICCFPIIWPKAPSWAGLGDAGFWGREKCGPVTLATRAIMQRWNLHH